MFNRGRNDSFPNCKIEREKGRTSLGLDDALEAAVNRGMIQLESSRSAKRGAAR
jgi:hypothetical protein